jgi:dTDP-4-dehydrorhamnose 3,5-epimerase
MRYQAAAVPGVWVVEPERHEDERGFFARIFDGEEFAARGLNPALAQASISFNRSRGTLRGMHWQAAPHEEDKLVRCTRGALYDVALDLRRGSPTYLRWHAEELSAANHRMLYIPKGCAHGLLTLADDTEVHYHIAQPWVPASARGARWNDPAFGIAWPEPARVISARDRGWPDYNPRP